MSRSPQRRARSTPLPPPAHRPRRDTTSSIATLLQRTLPPAVLPPLPRTVLPPLPRRGQPVGRFVRQRILTRRRAPCASPLLRGGHRARRRVEGDAAKRHLRRRAVASDKDPELRLGPSRPQRLEDLWAAHAVDAPLEGRR